MTINNTSHSNLVAIGKDGVLSPVWNSDADSNVKLLVIGDDAIFTMGVFNTMDGVSRDGFAVISLSGVLQ